jgi:hypothetical protein
MASQKIRNLVVISECRFLIFEPIVYAIFDRLFKDRGKKPSVVYKAISEINGSALNIYSMRQPYPIFGTHTCGYGFLKNFGAPRHAMPCMKGP